MKKSNTRGAITPVMSAEIFKLRQMGISYNQIGLNVGVSRQAVKQHLDRFVMGNRSIAPDATTLAQDASSSTGRVLGRLDETDAPQSHLGASDNPVETVGSRLDDVRAIIAKLDAQNQPLLAADKYDKYCRLEAHLALQLAALTPAPPPDPEHDPVNIDATRRVVIKLRRAVEAAEGAVRCKHCGQAPF